MVLGRKHWCKGNTPRQAMSSLINPQSYTYDSTWGRAIGVNENFF